MEKGYNEYFGGIVGFGKIFVVKYILNVLNRILRKFVCICIIGIVCILYGYILVKIVYFFVGIG